jgi:ABC-2 type transport system permease protein
MIHRGGWALMKSSWISWMQYRSFFFVIAFGWMIPPLIYLFVWSTAAGAQTIGGLNQHEFVAYYLILILINQFTFSQTYWTAGEQIRTGDLNPWLLRPMPFIYSVFASEVAGKVVMMTFVIPVAGVLALFLHPEFHVGLNDGLVFILTTALAWWLRFLWGYAIAMLAFWITRADALLAVQDALVFLLAGVVAPFSLLPGYLQTMATILPFRYMVGFPVEIITNQLHQPQVLTGLAIQTGWLVLALVGCLLIWRAGLCRYSAIGG